MAVRLSPPAHGALHPVKGVRIGVAQAGIRKAHRDDLTVFILAPGSYVGAVFTQNRYCAAPVQVCRQHLGEAAARALVINTGNANAGTGESGLAHARLSCNALAEKLGLDTAQVLPFSTGVIMEPLPVERLIAGLPIALADLKSDNWLRAAHAIMTTDTVAKGFSEQVQIGAQTVTVTGISKGAGMIRPNMATMLGYLATDAVVAGHLLEQLPHVLAEQSFNRITVDGDTSTNDSFVVMVTQQAGHPEIQSWQSAPGQALLGALKRIAQRLAQAIVRDGEGATKFITIKVTGGQSATECRQVAYSIAHSPLVKTAFFASDPNLGRILAAVGYAGIAELDQTKISLQLDEVSVVREGGRDPSYREELGQLVMKNDEITVHVDLGRGLYDDTVWTCDLSYDYVKINADYRS